jgi:multiple sugar transport system permease protein
VASAPVPTTQPKDNYHEEEALVSIGMTRSAAPYRPRLRPGVRNQILGLLFISPWLLGLLAFTVYPVLASLYYSFTVYNVIQPPRFVGLQNYLDMVTQDPSFPITLYNTLYMVILGLPAAIVISFLLAGLLNNQMVGRPLFRTIFFLPAIVPVVAVSMVWLWLYNPNYGLLNATLASLGMHVVPWLSSPSLAKLSLIIIGVWGQGTTIVIFLAALQDVPHELYDAARVDGANGLHRFVNITAPMCTPSILFVLITGLIGWFQYFTIPYIMTQGGPMQSTEVYSYYLFVNAFTFFKMGYASALAWILFLIIAVMSFIAFRSSGRWVYYAGG